MLIVGHKLTALFFSLIIKSMLNSLSAFLRPLADTFLTVPCQAIPMLLSSLSKRFVSMFYRLSDRSAFNQRALTNLDLERPDYKALKPS